MAPGTYEKIAAATRAVPDAVIFQFGVADRPGTGAAAAAAAAAAVVMLTRVVWGVGIWVATVVLRTLASWLVALLPSFGGVPAAPRTDAGRDLGFTMFAVTPPILPDLFIIVGTIATLMAVSKRDRTGVPYGNRMTNHVGGCRVCRPGRRR